MGKQEFDLNIQELRIYTNIPEFYSSSQVGEEANFTLHFSTVANMSTYSNKAHMLANYVWWWGRGIWDIITQNKKLLETRK